MSTAERPTDVTVVGILVIIAGALDILSGILILIFQNDAQAALGGPAGVVVTTGIVSIIFGVIELIVAIGVLRGNTAARMIVTIVQVLSVAVSVWTLIGGWGNAVSEWLSILFGVVVIIALWTRRANAFFRG